MVSSLLLFLVLAVQVTANAIHTNPSPSSVNIGLTRSGSDWLWAVFALMLLSTLAFIFWHTRLPLGQRVFHQLAIIILTTSTIAYFAMASNLGQTGIRTEFRGPGNRAIWYVRYIAWAIIVPLLLLEVLLAAGMPLADVVTVVFFGLAMVVTRLVGALVASSYKWGFFVMSVFCQLYLTWALLSSGRRTAGLLSAEHRTAFSRGAMTLCAIWLLYPICWGLSEGSNAITVTGEMVFYGIIDILSQPIFLFLHLRALERIPYDSYGFRSIHDNDRAAGITNGTGKTRPMEPSSSNAGTAKTAHTTATNNTGPTTTGAGINA